MASRVGELKEVERSPDGRYIRFDEKLGAGAYKAVWLAYDTEAGIEVAWNLVDLRKLPPKEKERLKSETEILRNLNHAHIVVFHQVWENPELEQVVFTTERVTSGSLKQYIGRIKPVKIKVIKKWCRQILLALIYLHSQSPPIIHRDLKCDNIFINGNSGDIRIGDLGLSTMRSQTHAVSVLGTPEFMAPELYDEYYNEKVDVYAFGMCVLEMVTNEYPYEECINAAQIFKKVAGGVPPSSIEKIGHRSIREFIKTCLGPQEYRPSALDLFHHPFLSLKSSDYRDGGDAGFTFPKAVPVSTPSTVASQPKDDISPGTTRPADVMSIPVSRQVTSQEVVLESTNDNIARIVLRIHIGEKRKEIKFPFDLETDTAEAVAHEMVKELKLDDSATTKLAEGIYNSIRVQRDAWNEANASKSSENSPSEAQPVSEKSSDGLPEPVGPVLTQDTLVQDEKEPSVPVLATEVEKPNDLKEAKADAEIAAVVELHSADKSKRDVSETSPLQGKNPSPIPSATALDMKDNVDSKRDLASTPSGEMKYHQIAESLSISQIKSKIIEMGGEEQLKTSLGLTKKELIQIFVDRCLFVYGGSIPQGMETPGTSRRGSMVRQNSIPSKGADGTMEAVTKSKAVASDSEFFQTFVANQEGSFTPSQLEAIQKINKKRESKLHMHKKAYLKAKVMTNKEFNTQLFETLKDWGFDVPQPSADIDSSSATTPPTSLSSKLSEPDLTRVIANPAELESKKTATASKFSSRTQKLMQSQSKGGTIPPKVVKKPVSDKKPETDSEDVGNIEIRLTQPFFE